MSTDPYAAQRAALVRSPVAPNDPEAADMKAVKEAEAKRRRFQALEFHRMKVEAKQAAARDLISKSEYDNYMHGDQSNALQRALFEYGAEAVTGEEMYNSSASGGVLETIGDVLSLPNYLVASATKATLDDPMLRMGGFGIGWSPEAFARAWHEKTDFVKLADEYAILGEEGSSANFWGGLAGDILMDPTTYLTFGVSTGSKVAVKTTTEIGAKGAARGGQVLAGSADATLTRFGRKIYQEAAQDLNQEFLEKMGTREGTDGVVPHLLDEIGAREWHQRIGDHMVDNFEKLQDRLAQRVVKGRHGVLGRIAQGMETVAPYVPGTDANMDLVRAGMAKTATMWRSNTTARAAQVLKNTADDMFQETASVYNKEMGLYNSTKMQQRLANAPLLGKSFKTTFDIFDAGWDAAPDVVSEVRLTKNRIQLMDDADAQRYGEVFKDLSPAAVQEMPRILEARALADHGEALLGTYANMHPRMHQAIAFVENEMDAILDAERKAGFNVGKVEGYINHVYKDPKAQEIVRDMIVRKHGQEAIKSENKFTQHRLIATINDVEEIYGKGALEMDAYKLLTLRKRASNSMIETNKLLQTISRDHGVSAKLVSDLKQGIPDGIIRAMMRKVAPGVPEVFQVDQVYREEQGN